MPEGEVDRCGKRSIDVADDRMVKIIFFILI